MCWSQGGPQYAAADGRIRDLRKKLDFLSNPLATVFEKRLKSPLEAMRTQKQIARAESRRGELDAMIQRAKRELDSSPAIEPAPTPAGP